MELWVPGSHFRRVGEGHLDPEALVRAWGRPDAVLIDVDAFGRVATAEGGGLGRSRPQGAFDPGRHYLLGYVGEVAWFAHVADLRGAASGLRELAEHLDDTERDIVTTAVALANWHRVTPLCGVCGGPTHVAQGGHVRYCPACDRERFPRTDPAVIVAVLDADDRLLLGHQASWENNRVSLLAGFVEAGESLEQAVRREVFEESGVRVGEVAYVASQPWPFPRSLMLAFVARAEAGAVAVDGIEIEWARFFTRDDVRSGVASGEITLPRQASIASRVVQLWLDGELPRP